jgi:hypothetical protein
LPTCPAEELALHLIVQDAPSAAGHGWTGLDEAAFDSLPEHPDDLEWDAMPGVLFQDTDILHLFEPGLNGIDDPHDALDAHLAIGDYGRRRGLRASRTCGRETSEGASADRKRPEQAPGNLSDVTTDLVFCLL